MKQRLESLKRLLTGRSRAWLQRRQRQEKEAQGWYLSQEVSFLPVSSLYPHPHHPRPHPDSQDIIELAHNLRFQGLGSPLIVIPRTEETYWIVDGIRRFHAVKHPWLSWQTVPCLLLPLQEEEMVFSLLLVLNLRQRPYSYWEQGVAFRQLREMLEVTTGELANWLRLPASHIRRCENLVGSLHAEIVSDCQVQGWLPNFHLLALAQLRQLPELQLQLYRRCRQENWTLEALRRHICPLRQGDDSLPREIRVDTTTLTSRLRLRGGAVSTVELKQHLAELVVTTFRRWRLSEADLADWCQRLLRYLEDQPCRS